MLLLFQQLKRMMFLSGGGALIMIDFTTALHQENFKN